MLMHVPLQKVQSALNGRPVLLALMLVMLLPKQSILQSACNAKPTAVLTHCLKT